MLLQKNDSNNYIQEFKKRFTNFAEKAPALLSFTTTPTGVKVIDETTDIGFDFEWEFTVSVKAFIHGIKETISPHCYPKMIHTTQREVPLTAEEQAELIAKGMNLDDVPSTRTVVQEKTYIIDRVISYKDIFLIIDEETREVFRYKMNSSCIFFLKKIRSGRLDARSAATYFFEKSVLLNEIVSKGGDD